MSDSPRPTPRRLAEFEIVRRLGAGGMAEVFLARKRGAEGTHKQLVVKRILPLHRSSQRFRSMFAEEAELATRLNHPNIVQVYEFQDYGDEGQLLSMEYVEGPDLRELQRAARQKDTRLPPYVAAYIISEVARGLHYAHERKDDAGKPLEIVHRDVSPQNILLSFDGAVKIADFGIATANMFRQETGVLKGKTGYMSPEQARGERVDRRTDVYSLGVVLHELLTGRPLHGAAEGKELLEAVRTGMVEPPSMYVRGIPAELEAIVMQALSVERERRFATTRDVATAITRVLFQKQQLVDAHTLEAELAQLVSRKSSDSIPAEDAASQESSSLEMSGAAGSLAERSTGSTGSEQQSSEVHEGREVRHVSIVTLRIWNREAVEHAIGLGQAERLESQVRATLDEIAYKRGTRWIWDSDSLDARESDVASLGPVRHGSDAPGLKPAEPKTLRSTEARAVVGLLANPSRAAADAAWLAIDVHEALAGACDGLSAALMASVSIIRGVAEGRRGKAGHLEYHTLQSPADKLSGLLGKQTEMGKTWVAGGIFRLVRRDFVWTELPNVELVGAEEFGLPTALRIYALERPLTRQERRQQQALAPRDLVGRDAELADLHAAYHQAITQARSNGNGHIVSRLVVGEMGIGKTALISTFLGELPPDARELRVECSLHSNQMPFSSAGQWLRELTGIRLDEPQQQAMNAIAEVMGDVAERESSLELVRRMADLATGRVAEAADEAEAQLHGRLLADGIRHFFARAAAQGPLVVTVDGLQWIDLPSLELLASLLRRAEPVPILILLVSRPDERVAHYLEGAVRVELAGLSTENQIRLVETHVGAMEGVAEACSDLIPRAAGNPFFLLEMVDALLERGLLDLREDGKGQLVLLASPNASGGEQALPSTLEQLIADRLNELPIEERSVVNWLSVAGGPLGKRDLTLLLKDDVDDAVIRLCARGLCDSKGELVDVRHPLTRDVAYLAIERRERSHMHWGLGELMARTVGGTGLAAASVARHFQKSEKPESAAQYFLEAANAARSSYQLPLAARYYQQALDVLPEMDERRLEPYSVLEDICRVQGRGKDRRRYLRALRACARHSGQGFWIATALIRHAQFDFDAGQLNNALHLAQLGEEVAQSVEARVPQVQAQSLVTEILRDLGEMQGALAACQRALATVQHPEVPPRVRADVLRAQATLLLRVGRIQEAVAAHAEAIAVFRQTESRQHEARSKGLLALAMYVLGRFEDAIALAFDSVRIDLSMGGRFQIARTLSTVARCYVQLGDYARAENFFKRAQEAHEKYEDQDSRLENLLHKTELQLELGNPVQAERVLSEAEQLSDLGGNSYDSVHAKLLRAAIAFKRGASGSAVVYAFDARQVAETQAYLSFHFYAMALEAAARVDVGEQHTGALLATTTLGAVESIQGCEYGLEIRDLCLQALEASHAPQLDDVRLKSMRYVGKLSEQIRDPSLRRTFTQRPVVQRLIGVQLRKQPGGVL